MSKGRLLKYISNISFALGAVLAVIALYLVFSARAGLPAGACPVNNSLPLAIPALVLLVTAFITSFYAEKPKMKDDTEEKPSDPSDK